MSILEEFRQIKKEPFNQYLQDCKKNGKRIIGTFCSYIPEELISAAGMQPFRMRATGSTKTTLGDTWFSSFNCSFVRNIFDLALEDEFCFLDGLVFMNSCDHVRRMHDNWKEALDYPAFNHFIAVPHKLGEKAIDWYRDELNIFKDAIEKNFGVKITDEAIRDEILTYNRIRRHLNRLYGLRRQDPPPITGAETLTVLMAGTALPPKKFERMLESLLVEIIGREVSEPGLPRLMLVSGCMEETEQLELIESLGANVVDDAICFGRRYFDTLVDETADDPMDALAARYMLHLSCPRISDDVSRRLEYINSCAEISHVDGIICEKLKFCDLWGGESFILKQEAKKNGLPFLAFERELYGGAHGQIKTRVQAFLEYLSVKQMQTSGKS